MTDNVRVLPRTIPEATVQAVLAAAQASGQLLFDWDVSADRLRWIDPPAGKIFGYPSALLSTMQSWLDLVHPEDALSLRLANESLLRDRQQPVAVEYRVRDAAGQWQWVESHGRILAGAPHSLGRDRYVGLLANVTARKRTESQLAISALMLESIYDAVVVTQSDDTIHWVNGAAAKLFSQPVAGLQGRKLSDFNADSRERQLELQQEIRDTVSGHGLWRGRYHCLAGDGSAFLTDAAVTRVQGDQGDLWIHVRRDLRDRVQMQQAALDSSRLEQQKLGEVLHESVCQQLTAAALTLRSLTRDLTADQLARALEVEKILCQSIADCRRMADEIAPFVLGQHGLAVAMQGLGHWAEQRGASRVSVAVSGAAGQIAGNSAYLVHRVAQVIIAEVCEQSKGANIDVRVWQDSDRIVVSIADDVARTDSASALEEQRMIAFQAEAVGATIEQVRLANGGRRVLMQIPERFVETTAKLRKLSA